jgi:hypothetical protein
MPAEEFAQLFHAVSIDTVGCYIRGAYFGGQRVTFLFGARGYDNLVEYIGMLGAFVSDHCAYASGTDDDYFVHILMWF